MSLFRVSCHRRVIIPDFMSPAFGRVVVGPAAWTHRQVVVCASRMGNLERAPTGFRELAQLFLDVEPCCRANGDALITSSGSPGTLRGCARPLFARGELFVVGDAGGCVQAVGRSSHGSLW